ncbi:MAG TPA: tetratricopeptide repeat protein [Chitinophagaceae bacterium]|nr:tetratricopeptide repeat protein [Chitinophagaceae bacterium]
MKKIPFFLLFSILTAAALAQKPSKEQMEADKKRMAEAQKKLNDQLSKLNPEARKGYDSLLNVYGGGQKMDNAIQEVSSNNQTVKSGKTAAGLIPEKNKKRIASIATTPSNAGISTFISTIGKTTFAAVLPAAKNKANEIYTALKREKANAAAIGNAAIFLWMEGHTQIALSLMAQVCTDEPNNTDNLGNYASMLTMMGAPELAIPVLNNLHARFKQNSTILNNLGQAWFALGDTDKAEKYLDSTLIFAANHPEANFTKCLIEENKGNKTAAVAYGRKSLKQSYSKRTIEELNKLGYSPSANDYNTFPPVNKTNDLLNLGGFEMPPFPTSVAACKALETVWKQFRADIDNRMKPLQKITNESTTQMQGQLEDMQNQFMTAMNKAIANPGSVSQSEAMGIVGAPMYSEKMTARENIILENLQKKKTAAIQAINDFKLGEGAAMKKKYEDAINAINKKYADVGEGGQTTLGEICQKSVKASDEFLKPYNTKLETLYRDYLAIEKQLINEISYSSLYTTYPKMLPGIVAGLQMQWLRDLSLTQNGFNFESVTKYDCAEGAEGKNGKLTEFKNPNCTINSELNTPVGSIKLDCSGMTTKFNIAIVGIEFNQDLDHAGFGDSFKDCTISIGPKTGVDAKMGLVEVSAKVGAGVDIKVDRTGVTDVGITGSIEAGANILDFRETSVTEEANASPVGASAGMEGRVSLNTGAVTVNGTGVFK